MRHQQPQLVAVVLVLLLGVLLAACITPSSGSSISVKVAATWPSVHTSALMEARYHSNPQQQTAKPNQTQQTNLTLPRLKLCSEFLADQDAALFWDYIDALTAANGVADSTTSAADAQRAAMKAAETSIGGTVQGVRQRHCSI